MPNKMYFDVEEIKYYRSVNRFTWKMIADFMGCNVKTVIRFAKSNKLPKTINRLSGIVVYNSRANKKARFNGYEDARDMVNDLRRSGKTKEEISRMTGLHVSNVHRYQAKELRGEIFIYTEKFKRAARRNLKVGSLNSRELKNKGQHAWQINPLYK